MASRRGAKLIKHREIFTFYLCYRKHNINNSVALVRERTIPTKRPQLVGEVRPTFAD
jgi:hypothetical protein